MTDLGKGLRARLAATHEVRWPAVAERTRSVDGTVKFLFRLDDGATIESVFIPEERRRTVCISTQAGCPLKCAFCLTGIAGYKRNLKPWEILGQVATVMEEAPPRDQPWNIVVMGMGEPLLNYESTVAALRILMDPEGFAVAPRKLTLSTVGILPALRKLAKEPVRPNLAISLHAPNARLRRELMPIEDKYALEDVIEAAKAVSDPQRGPRDLRVRAAARRERLAGPGPGARAPAARLAGQGEPHTAEPGARDPLRGPDTAGGRRVREGPGRRAGDRLRPAAAGPGHPGRLRAIAPEADGAGGGRLT